LPQTIGETEMIAHQIAGPSAWHRTDIRSEDYRVVLSGGCLDEIRRAAEELRAYPLPTILRSPDEFQWPHCRVAMAGPAYPR
jgi:hypothetical protein